MRAILLLASLAIPAAADQLAWIAEKDADRAVTRIESAGVVAEYCCLCEDKTVRIYLVEAVRKEQVDTDYWQVEVDGRLLYESAAGLAAGVVARKLPYRAVESAETAEVALDLAYAYVPGEDGSFVCVGKALDLECETVESFEVPDEVREGVRFRGASPQFLRFVLSWDEPPLPADEVAALLAALGDESWEAREEATRRLLAAGRGAFVALQAVDRRGLDSEVRSRLDDLGATWSPWAARVERERLDRDVLFRIALLEHADPAIREAAAASLARLVPGLEGPGADEMRARWAEEEPHRKWDESARAWLRER